MGHARKPYAWPQGKGLAPARAPREPGRSPTPDLRTQPRVRL